MLRTEAMVPLKLGCIVRTFPDRTHHNPAVRLEEIGGSSFGDALPTGSDSVARAPGWSNFGDQESGFTVVEHMQQELIVLDLLPFSILCADSNGRVGSNTCRQIGNAQSQVEDVNGAGLRLLVKTLHLSLPQTKIQRQNEWVWRSTQGTKHRIDFCGIAEAVQPFVHSCAPTGRAVVRQRAFSGSSSGGVGVLSCRYFQSPGFP